MFAFLFLMHFLNFILYFILKIIQNFDIFLYLFYTFLLAKILINMVINSILNLNILKNNMYLSLILEVFIRLVQHIKHILFFLIIFKKSQISYHFHQGTLIVYSQSILFQIKCFSVVYSLIMSINILFLLKHLHFQIINFCILWSHHFQ